MKFHECESFRSMAMRKTKCFSQGVVFSRLQVAQLGLRHLLIDVVGAPVARSEVNSLVRCPSIIRVLVLADGPTTAIARSSFLLQYVCLSLPFFQKKNSIV